MRGQRQSADSYALAMYQTLPEPAERKPRAKPVQHEREQQCAVVAFIRRCVPGAVVSATVNEATPNASARGSQFRFYSMRKKQGVQYGFPDLTLLLPGPRVAFIEMKRPGYTKSDVQDNQRELHALLRSMGFPVGICTCVDDAREFLRQIGVRTLEAAEV